MPARVVVVHDDPVFVEEVAGALRSAGHEVATFPDPMAAWDALKAPRQTEVLLTSVQFGPGRSNGVALARMARTSRPGIRVLFTAPSQDASYTDGLGAFMSVPVDVPDVVEAVERLLMSDTTPLAG